MFDKTGSKYGEFVIESTVDLPEIQCCLRQIIHEPTKAQVLHIANEDPENTFCLSFQTLPKNSNGVAHILEHTVLCGSRKFPVKDPFFTMLRRSLNTFMNAFTGPDFTCYAAASCVPKDFYNLLDVYLDAVFHPNLKRLSFLQEGHRFEFAEPGNKNTPLEIKGIVYNEMKGAMSSPEARVDEAMHKLLFPDVTYGYNSGGSPDDIPKLSYSELIDFHKTFYHPSRCLFFFYGNMPIEGHLDFIAKNLLDQSVEPQNIPSLSCQPRFTEPKKETISYPFPAEENPEGKAIISFGWLTCSTLEQNEVLALTALEIILMGQDAALLKGPLLRSGICKQGSMHMEESFFEVPSIITLRGCNPENAEKLTDIIQGTFRTLVETGIHRNQIENAIHQIEFHRSEIVGNHHPFGLDLFMRSGLLKQHGGKPEDGLKVHELCDAIRKEVDKDAAYLTGYLKKYYLDNPHFVTVVAAPDSSLAKNEALKEKVMLEAISNSLDEKKKSMIVEEAEKLIAFQEEQQMVDINILPKVTLKDVPKEARNYPLLQETCGSTDLFFHDSFTNGIVYADLCLPLPQIQEKELPLLKLFSQIITQVGCGGRSFAENLEYIQANTGGFVAGPTLFTKSQNCSEITPAFQIVGKALYRKADKLFALLRDTIESVDFSDIVRLKEIITKHSALLESSYTQNALRYAILLSSSKIGPAERLENAWGGLEYYHFIKELSANFDRSSQDLVRQLKSLQERIFNKSQAHLVITCDKSKYEELKKEEFFGLCQMAEKPGYAPWTDHFPLSDIPSQARMIPSPVAFTCTTFPTLSYVHPDTAALGVASHLFDNITLHQKIREQGGAYGSGAVNHSTAGFFCFYAYRDPNIVSSLEAFQDSIENVANGEFSEEDLEEAKLEIIQSLDSPVAPGSRGHIAYAWLREGKTVSVRQKFRDHLLSLTRDDVINAVKRHIAPMFSKGAVVTFSGRELIEKENLLLVSKGKEPLKIEQ